jgi:hypothetical protein
MSITYVKAVRFFLQNDHVYAQLGNELNNLLLTLWITSLVMENPILARMRPSLPLLLFLLFPSNADDAD